MKIFFFLFFLSNILFAQIREPFNNLSIPEDTVYILEDYKALVNNLKKKTDSVDEYHTVNEKSVELMALISDTLDPVIVNNGEWPENTVVSINLLRDRNGSIIYYAEYPFSQSGDWFIGYEYYVDTLTGHIYGFRRTANFFNSMCVDGVLEEESMYFFNNEFKLIGKEYILNDTDGKDVLGASCYFPYDYVYNIPENIKELVN
jgi:hypothetical protein